MFEDFEDFEPIDFLYFSKELISLIDSLDSKPSTIKRVVYAVIVFLVPFIVNVGLGLLANATGTNETNSAVQEKTTALQCWNAAK